MNKEIKNMDIPIENLGHIEKLKDNISKCSNISLYSYNLSNSHIKYIGSHTCTSKFCFICNWNRQKKIRRKLLKWFRDNKHVYELKKGYKTKYCTILQLSKYKDWEKIAEIKYDVMHLTLTVPHYKESGFKGNEYYFKELSSLFDSMRKHEFWINWVLGGEYGIETTQSDNGLHIHIHSLLLVKSFEQNRNHLHLKLTKAWNELTINEYSERTEFTEEVIEKICKSNKLIDREFANSLNPQGTTLINLENIYNWVDGKKNRNIEFGSDNMLKSILEVVKYHFEPKFFDKEKEEFNLPLLFKLLPVIYRMQLYRKIGIWHGEKALNLDYQDPSEELEEVIETIDKETGEIMSEEREFLLMNPAYIFHEKERILASRAALLYGKKLECHNTREAVKLMGSIVKENCKNQVKRYDIEKNDVFVN
jgi:hypothetical protein